jgi:hypothetical protein
LRDSALYRSGGICTSRVEGSELRVSRDYLLELVTIIECAVLDFDQRLNKQKGPASGQFNALN